MLNGSRLRVGWSRLTVRVPGAGPTHGLVVHRFRPVAELAPGEENEGEGNDPGQGDGEVKRAGAVIGEEIGPGVLGGMKDGDNDKAAFVLFSTQA